MKKIKFFPIALGFLLVLSASSLVKADGQYGGDITVTGKVVTAIVDDATGHVFVLLPERKGAPLPGSIKTGEKVSVFGDKISQNGHLSLRVEKVK